VIRGLDFTGLCMSISVASYDTQGDVENLFLP
jgi:hypothetical protein